MGQANNVPVVPVSVDGATTTCGTGGSCEALENGSLSDEEQALDIEYAISMAPGLSQLRVYVAPPDAGGSNIVDAFTAMETDKNLCMSLSCSWGWYPDDPTTLDPIFEGFEAQGQSLFAASGDHGSYPNSTGIYYPAEDANVTSVGGTDLTTTGGGGAWVSETAWNQPPYASGVSPDHIPIPGYQLLPGVITAANGGSTVYRNVPDVAANAELDNYICHDGTCGDGWGGTSFAAPIWAGFLALANQQAVSNGLPVIGSLNNGSPSPTNWNTYTLGTNVSEYPLAFHDITSGSNGEYNAVAGYDLVTGWGSPNGMGAILSMIYTSLDELWQNATYVGSGWYYLSWFNYFYLGASGWIYHNQLGWLYPAGASNVSSPSGVWLWDLEMNAWLWTSDANFPWIYRDSDNTWLYYDEWTTDPCWFYNNTTGEWQSYMPSVVNSIGEAAPAPLQ